MRLFAIILGLAIPFAFVTLVAGHASPERFDPPVGAVLEQAPARIDGWFTQDVRRTEESFLRVLDEAGDLVSQPAVIDDADRRHMYAELQPGLGPGRYLVAWQTFSDEDEEVDGACFLFFVGQAAADKAHQDRVRIDDPESCPVMVEAGEQPAGGTAEPSSVSEGDEGVPVAALIGATIGAAAGGLTVGGAGAWVAVRRRGK